MAGVDLRSVRARASSQRKLFAASEPAAAARLSSPVDGEALAEPGVEKVQTARLFAAFPAHRAAVRGFGAGAWRACFDRGDPFGDPGGDEVDAGEDVRQLGAAERPAAADRSRARPACRRPAAPIAGPPLSPKQPPLVASGGSSRADLHRARVGRVVGPRPSLAGRRRLHAPRSKSSGGSRARILALGRVRPQPASENVGAALVEGAVRRRRPGGSAAAVVGRGEDEDGGVAAHGCRGRSPGKTWVSTTPKHVLRAGLVGIGACPSRRGTRPAGVKTAEVSRSSTQWAAVRTTRGGDHGAGAGEAARPRRSRPRCRRARGIPRSRRRRRR